MPVLPLVRQEVQRLLTQSSAFRALPPDERRELAHGMVRIANYAIGGAQGDNVPGNALVAYEQATPPLPKETASDAMKKSGAAAADEGGREFVELVEGVDFPKFVAGLIDGVFTAIVDASIKQMEAYAELVKNVAKSAEEFMRDNVSPNQARDYLVDRYPDHLRLDTSSAQPTVQVQPTADENAMPDFFADLGLPAPSGGGSPDNATIEEQLVPAARRRLALDRQQLLITMVMMGINRIVVTDGSIRASVKFDLHTKDAVRRASSETHLERERKKSRPGFIGWFSGYDQDKHKTNLKVDTMTSTDTSQSSVDLKAKLAGEVNVRFRSETFPLDKMTSLLAPDTREKVQARLPQAAAPAPAAPPPPALPPLPATGR